MNRAHRKIYFESLPARLVVPVDVCGRPTHCCGWQGSLEDILESDSLLRDGWRPLSATKSLSGGFQLDYVGFWMDYARFEIGMSERRTNWLIRFIDEMETNDWLVNARRFQEFHGRLGFASQIKTGKLWLVAGCFRKRRTL